MGLKKFKISFCTVCMDRMHHLQLTLLENILDNISYDNLEFVLLDYNSKDDLEIYVETYCSEYIKNGKLIYYKTFSPEFFNRSHSRNMVYKLATGDLICNLDADNFTGKDFALYLNGEFNRSERIYLTTIGFSNFIGGKDTLGRICVRREDFYDVRGYDERIIGYGFEDYDFANRLEFSGLSRVSFHNDKKYFKVIKHEKIESISNEFAFRNLKQILIRYLTPSSTDFIFLFNDKTFRKGVLIDNRNPHYGSSLGKAKNVEPAGYEFSIFSGLWEMGNWDGDENELILYEENLQNKLIFNSKGFYNTSVHLERYYKLTGPHLIEEAVMTFSQINNRFIMNQNKTKNVVRPNLPAFGNGVVFRNFEYSIPISI